ncbi:MAG TPA: hypothetical protein VGM77_10275 [Gemmatimonadales bacterium]|jgi:hypothetical protein
MPGFNRVAAIASLGLSAVLASCGSSDGGSGSGSLTITSSSVANAGLRANLLIPSNGGGGTGVNATSIKVGMYALYVAKNSDCSSPVLVVDYGATPVVKNFVAGDDLFSGTPDAGTYNCAAIKMSDVVQFTPATDLSPCQAGTVTSEDIYQAGSTDFRDLNLAQVVGHGGNGAGVDDQIYLIFTTDPASAEARGFSANQVIPILTALTPPATATFVWSAAGTVVPSGFACTLPTSAIGFR